MYIPEMALTFTEKARKVSELTKLLADPEVAAVARWLLGDQISATPQSNTPNFLRPKQTVIVKKRRGELQQAAFNVVKNAMSPLSAKRVAELMEANGFQFEAVDRQIAVSKVLRKLKDQQRIAGKKINSGGKSAFVYSAIAQASVEGTTH
jgi:hypothetical protein